MAEASLRLIQWAPVYTRNDIIRPHLSASRRSGGCMAIRAKHRATKPNGGRGRSGLGGLAGCGKYPLTQSVLLSTAWKYSPPIKCRHRRSSNARSESVVVEGDVCS